MSCLLQQWASVVELALIHGSFSLVPGRAVTDSINQLITMCTQQAPGQKECDNALRELEVRSHIFMGSGEAGMAEC